MKNSLRGALFLFVLSCASFAAEERQIAVGYFPNITHAHALVAQNMAAEGKGWFEERIPGLAIRWVSFNAGPSAMEALFAKAVDITYVGPGPVLNASIRSGGGVVVLSGAVRGGAGLIVPKDSPLALPADFKGKRIATPQLGNTQDIACRHWLTQAGLRVTMTGGDATVVPASNPDILTLFALGEVDAAWTVEPWLSRLEMEVGGRVAYMEPTEESITTVLSAGRELIESDPGFIRAFAAAHRELTRWMIDNPEEAKKRVAAELTRQMRREFPAAVVERAWPRLLLSSDVTNGEFAASLQAAKDAGFIKGDPDIGGLVVAP